MNLLLLIIIVWLIPSANAMQQIILETGDGAQFVVDSNLLKTAKTLQECYESIDYEKEKVIPIVGLNGAQLGELLCCYKQLDTQPEKEELLYKYSRNIISLLNSADYLGMHKLVKSLKKSLLQKCDNKEEWQRAVQNASYENQFPFADKAVNKELGFELLKKRRYNLKHHYEKFSNKIEHPSIKSINTSVALSIDGTQLAVGTYGIIRLWHPEEKKLVETNCNNASYIHYLIFDPQNINKIAARGRGTVKIFDLGMQTCIQEFEASVLKHSSAIAYLGNVLVSSGGAGISLWDTRQQKTIARLKRKNGSCVKCISVDNGNTILSGSWDRCIDQWNMKTLSCERIFESESSVNTVDFSPNYKQFASGDAYGIVKIWDMSTGKRVRTINSRYPSGRVMKLAYLNGKDIVTHYRYRCYDNRDEINIFKKNNCLHTINLPNKGLEKPTAVSPDGKKIAVVGPLDLDIIEFENLDKYKDCTLVDAMKVLHHNFQLESSY